MARFTSSAVRPGPTRCESWPGISSGASQNTFHLYSFSFSGVSLSEPLENVEFGGGDAAPAGGHLKIRRRDLCRARSMRRPASLRASSATTGWPSRSANRARFCWPCSPGHDTSTESRLGRNAYARNRLPILQYCRLDACAAAALPHSTNTHAARPILICVSYAPLRLVVRIAIVYRTVNPRAEFARGQIIL